MPEQNEFLNYYQILVFKYICVWHVGSRHDLLRWMVVQINSWTLGTESLYRSSNIGRHHHKDANAVVLFGSSRKHQLHGVIFSASRLEGRALEHSLAGDKGNAGWCTDQDALPEAFFSGDLYLTTRTRNTCWAVSLREHISSFSVQQLEERYSDER